MKLSHSNRGKLREDLRRLNEERMARESHLTNSHNPMTRERAETIMSEKDRIENARGLMQRLELLGTTIADLKIYRDEDDRYVRSVCERFGLSEVDTFKEWQTNCARPTNLLEKMKML